MAIHGKNGTVTYTAAQATVTKWTLNIEAEAVECTSMTGTLKDRILGLKDWSGTVECFLVAAGPTIGSAAALTVMAAYDDSADTSINLVLSNGVRKITGKAYAESFGVGSPVDFLL